MPEDTTVPPPPAFKFSIEGINGPGPDWRTDAAKAALARIGGASGVAQAQAQAAVEQVVVLHSIRRILLVTSVVIPLVLLAISIILLAVAPS